MNFAKAVLLNDSTVSARAIAHVGIELVCGIDGVIVAHEVIAGDFCKNRSGGDGFDVEVAFDNCGEVVGENLAIAAVDEDKIGLDF